MKRQRSIILAIGLMLALGGCSSSQVSDEESGDIPPEADAATDAVPQADAENPDAAQTAEAPPADIPPPADEAIPPPAETAKLDTPPVDAPPPAMEPPTAPVAPPPAPAIAEAPKPSEGHGGMEDYTVQRGDTLMQIAFETYGDLYKWKDIYEANKDRISNPNNIPAGTVLKVEKPGTPVTIERNGEKYLIKKRDTLGSISKDVYGTQGKWRKLWENNKQMIKNPNKIFAGFYLYYTDGEKQLAPAPMADAAPEPAAPVSAEAPVPAVDGAVRTPTSTEADQAPQAALAPPTDGAIAPPVQQQGESVPVTPGS